MPPRPAGILADLDALSVLERGSGTGGDVLTEMVERWAIDVKNGHAQRKATRALVRTQAERLGLPADSFLFAFDSAAAVDERTNGHGKTSREKPAEARVSRERTPEEIATVLVPGFHTDDEGTKIEVGADDFARAVLDALPDGAVYRMDREVGTVEGDPGARSFRTLDEASARILVDSHVRLGRWATVRATEDAPAHQSLVFVSCSRDAAILVLAAARADQSIRELQQVVRHPVYLPGLTLCEPGWNSRGGVFYDEPAELVGVKPDPQGALHALDDLVVDFPFKDDASRENVYAAMLTLILRPAVEGPVPFFLAMAPLERTGKGKLIDTAVGAAVAGGQVPPMQIGRDEAETEKRLTAQILHGATIVHLDNVPVGEVLDSPSLASLATAWPRWSGRRLGGSEIVTLPNRLVVLMSANNPTSTGELVKRTVPIVLSPKNDHPELRDDFVHPDCVAYAAQRRPIVLAALLGIVEAWKAADRPATRQRLGGFERWTSLVISAIEHAGAKSVLGNYREWVRSANDQNADIECLVAVWAKKHTDSPVTASQVLDLVEANGIFHDVIAKPTKGGQLMALTRKVLRPLVGRPVGPHVVTKHDSGSNTLYCLGKSLFDDIK